MVEALDAKEKAGCGEQTEIIGGYSKRYTVYIYIFIILIIHYSLIIYC